MQSLKPVNLTVTVSSDKDTSTGLNANRIAIIVSIVLSTGVVHLAEYLCPVFELLTGNLVLQV
jgi:hypothetical protein